MWQCDVEGRRGEKEKKELNEWMKKKLRRKSENEGEKIKSKQTINKIN